MTFPFRALVALLAAAALLAVVPSAQAATQVSIDELSGVLSIVHDMPDGRDGVIVSHGSGNTLRIEVAVDGDYESLAYVSGPECDQTIGGQGEIRALDCDAETADLVGSISADLGAGADQLDTTWLTQLGEHTPSSSLAEPVDPDNAFAVEVHLGAGDDVLRGGPLTENVYDGVGADQVSADAGRDHLVQPDASDPALSDAGDVLDAGTGFNSVSYYGRPAGVTVALDERANDGAPGENDDVALNAYEVIGTDSADTLIGDDTAQYFRAGAGNDVLDGNGGDDELAGGLGNDAVTGGAGNDMLFGDEGDDVLNAVDGEEDSIVSCDIGVDTATVDASPLDNNVGPGCESITRVTPVAPTPPVAPTTPVTPTPVKPAPQPVAPGYAPPKGAKVSTDKAGRMKFSFACEGVPCAAKTLTLRAKVGKRTVKVLVKVPALAVGESATVKVKLSKQLAKAVRKAGKRGVKASLTGLAKPIALTLIKR